MVYASEKTRWEARFAAQKGWFRASLPCPIAVPWDVSLMSHLSPLPRGRGQGDAMQPISNLDRNADVVERLLRLTGYVSK
jgi:hypothetical protein